MIKMLTQIFEYILGGFRRDLFFWEIRPNLQEIDPSWKNYRTGKQESFWFSEIYSIWECQNALKNSSYEILIKLPKKREREKDLV